MCAHGSKGLSTVCAVEREVHLQLEREEVHIRQQPPGRALAWA